MPDDEKLSPADPKDIAHTVAFSLLFSGRKRVHDSDKYTAAIAADRIVRHLERAGFERAGLGPPLLYEAARAGVDRD
jgi:hypothetical protein